MPNSAIENDRANTSSSQHQFESAINYLDVLGQNFGRIDTDGSNTLSRGELDVYIKADGPIEATSAAAVTLENFDQIKDMAKQSSSTRPFDSGFSTSESSFAWLRNFSEYRLPGDVSNSITRVDLNAMNLSASKTHRDELLASLRQSETNQAIFAGVTGGLITALGAYALYAAPGPLKLVGLGLGALGVGLLGHSVYEAKHRGSNLLQQEIEARSRLLGTFKGLSRN